jgi:glycosyltransferase involved in cell wall biosynthesis
MHVCMIAYTFYEGDSRVRRYAETLLKRGDHVDAIVLRQHGSDRIVNVSGVTVYKIHLDGGDEKRTVEYLGNLMFFFIRAACLITIMHFKKKYDIIQVHSVSYFEVFSAIIPKLTGAKVLLDIHDIVPELFAGKYKVSKGSWFLKLLLFLEKVSIAFSDHVIVANHIRYERLITGSVHPGKCTVIMNYPDPALFRQRAVQSRHEKFIVLCSGTSMCYEGVETAIRAIDVLREGVPEVELHIYGKVSEENYDVVKNLRLEKKVVFLGTVPLEELSQVYSEADVGIVPKLKNEFSNEVFSSGVFEFMLMGVPVIISATKVHTHYFNQNMVQFFRSEDAADLARGIVELKNEKRLRENLVANAQKFMLGNNWDVKKSIYLDLVKSLSPGCEIAGNYGVDEGISCR